MSLLTGCATLPSEHAAVPDSGSQRETGTASYYASRYQNRKTASGQRLDNSAMTAAHRTLPFGTEVVVRNVNNGKSVRVTINDRGPFVEGRIIDLTRAAFAQIADLDAGLVKVEIQVAH
jgi:rare lipoprotein A